MTVVKLIPHTIGIFRNGRFNPQERVLSVIAHQPGQHKSCIKSDMTAVEIVTAVGARWYGCSRAWITSSLRMAIELAPGMERDEVLAEWEDYND